jgi:hypothetical protein
MICVALLQNYIGVEGAAEGSIKVEDIYIKHEIPEAITFPPVQNEDQVRLFVCVCVCGGSSCFRAFIAPKKKL